jgi:hypothetical protein
MGPAVSPEEAAASVASEECEEENPAVTLKPYPCTSQLSKLIWDYLEFHLHNRKPRAAECTLTRENEHSFGDGVCFDSEFMQSRPCFWAEAFPGFAQHS